MPNRLDPIILQKQHEVKALYQRIEENPLHPLAQLHRNEITHFPKSSLKNALKQEKVSVIAEIKRKSPSKGDLAPIADPITLAKRYLNGGASALSILTDTHFFGGNLGDLKTVAAHCNHSIPILRKDFIIDPIQIAESALAGADAILAIVAVLDNRTKFILNAAKALGTEVLVEVHNKQELEIALDSGAEMIGVNNRNLKAFEVNTNLAFELIQHIPKNIVKVAASGISNPELAIQYCQAGFDAVLIGESLVRSENPESFIRACYEK